MRTVKVYSMAKDADKAVATNFKVREFGCKDGSDAVFMHPMLVDILQQIRNHFKKPVIINSAFRTTIHNKSVGGAKNSQHLYGCAADIAVSGVSPKKVAEYVETLLAGKGGIGVYSNFVHIDVRDKKARW